MKPIKKNSNEPKLTDEVVKYITDSLNSISEKYNQPKKLIHEIYRPLITVISSTPPNLSFSMPRQVEDFLKAGISARKISSLIRQVGIEEFRKLLFYTDYLGNDFTPIYSLDELIKVIQMFQKHLNSNMTPLMDTGYPNRLFVNSKWLNSLLNKNYFLKLAKINRRKSSLKYSWVCWTSDTSKPIENCSYNKAGLIHPKLNTIDISAIEKLRKTIHYVKTRIIGIALNSLENESIKTFWKECLDIIDKSFDAEDKKLLIKSDNLYPQYGIAAFNDIAFSDTANAGGIIDIFEFMGHVEQEIRCKSHALIREQLSDYFNRKFSYGSRFDKIRFINEIIFGGSKRCKSFSRSINKSLSNDQIFWQEYYQRRNNQFIEDLRPTSISQEELEKSFRRFENRLFNKIQPTSDTRSDQPAMKISEANRSILCGDENYNMTFIFFMAVDFIFKRHKEGVPYVKKSKVFDYVYQGDVPTSVLRKSIRQWFISNGGDVKKFAIDGHIIILKQGTCSLAYPIESIEVIPLQDPDNIS